MDRQKSCPLRIMFQEVMYVDGKGSLLMRATRAFDLPADGITGLPRIELIGKAELRMERHRGILAYGPEEIHVSGGKLVVRVRGQGLELRAMNPTELLITGEISAVELV